MAIKIPTITEAAKKIGIRTNPPAPTPAPPPPKPVMTFNVGQNLTPEQKARALAVVQGNKIVETPKGTYAEPLVPTPNNSFPKMVNDLVKSTYQIPARAAASALF